MSTQRASYSDRVKFIAVLVAISCVLLVSAGNSAAMDPAEKQRKVTSSGGYEAVLDKLHRDGTVRLIVTLNTPFQPMGHLQKHEAQLQRDTIAAMQSEIHASLQGLNVINVTNFVHVPQIALTANLDAFETLLVHPSVLSVVEDIPVPYILNLSVPRIGAPAVWGQGFTGAGTAVAILDTGVDKTHPFLSGAVVSEACYSTNDAAYASSSVCPGGVTDSTAVGSAMPYAGNCPAGECDHGTHVAGIAAGRDNGSIAGVAKGAGVIAIQVFSRFDSSLWCDGTPPCALTFPSDYIKGLQRVYELRSTYNIAAANMSLGGGGYSGYCDGDPAKPSIDNLKSVNIATVIASGNSYYTNAIGAPACVSSAVSVGATTDSDSVASYSNSAFFLSLLAPGSSITSSIPGGGYSNWNGTSMAAPHVTGAWALLKQAYPSESVGYLLSALASTGLSIYDGRNAITKPRIQVDSALAFLENTSFGKPNLVWRNRATGANALWYLNGTSFRSAAQLPVVTDQNWRMVGFADFDHDGHPDIVWSHTSGASAVWHMNGATFRNAVYLLTASDQNWKMAGIADFDHDNQPDIVWRNSATGANAVWYMNGTSFRSAAQLPAVTDQNWRMVGFADFDHDGQTDIVWSHTSGMSAVWHLNGATFRYASYLLASSDQNWKMVGVADFDDDNQPDIAWRNSATGASVVWYLNGTTFRSAAQLPTVTDLSWVPMVTDQIWPIL